MSSQHQKMNRLVDFGTTYSLIVYIIMAIIKIIFGTIGNSKALFTDGLNSVSDVLATGILFIGLKVSRKPRDEDHAYGHYRYEDLSTLIASLIMFIIGGQALIDSISAIFNKSSTEPTMVAAVAAVISIMLIISSAVLNLIISKKANVSASRAVAKNNLSDAATAFGALIAIISSRFNMPVIDTIASFLISLVILHTAWTIFKEAGQSLTDGFDKKELDIYRTAIAKIDGVLEVKDIRGRMLGNFPTLDVEIAVDGQLSVIVSHEIADKIENMLKSEYSIYRTHVHIEPSLIEQ